MTTAAVRTITQAPFWYVTRSSAIIAFVLLTVALAFGVAATQRSMASPAWPRFATQTLHRNVSLLGLAFIAVHVVTTIVDGYVSVSWWSVVVPGASAYKTFSVALGTIAFDLALVVSGTSLIRLSMNARLWRRIHWSAYALWPLALLHFLLTGTDAAHGRFGMWLGIGCAVVVLLAAGISRVTRDAAPRRTRSVR